MVPDSPEELSVHHCYSSLTQLSNQKRGKEAEAETSIHAYLFMGVQKNHFKSLKTSGLVQHAHVTYD